MNYDAEDTVNESAEDMVNNDKEDVVSDPYLMPFLQYIQN